MDNKVTKERINNHLEYGWFKYLLFVIAGIVLFVFIFGQINRDQDYETIDFFISSYSSSTNDFESKTMHAMGNEMEPKFGENVIRSVNFNVQDPLGKEYGTLLMTQGAQSSDVLILGKKTMEGSMAYGFITLTDELLTEYLLPTGIGIDDLEYYTVEQGGITLRKGIRVDTFAKMSGTGGILEMDYKKTHHKDTDFGENLPDTEFYLGLNSKSVNMGQFSDKGKPKNGQALYCVQKFIQFYRKA